MCLPHVLPRVIHSSTQANPVDVETLEAEYSIAVEVLLRIVA